MLRFVFLLFSILIISACQNGLRAKRVSPEFLLSSSSENISFSLQDKSSLDSVKKWISDDFPTEAVIKCYKDNALCKDAEKYLNENGISTTVTSSSDETSNVDLVYTRVTARDCSNRGFGCSISVNSLHMVADRTHYITPPLSDPHSASKAVENYNNSFGK